MRIAKKASVACLLVCLLLGGVLVNHVLRVAGHSWTQKSKLRAIHSGLLMFSHTHALGSLPFGLAQLEAFGVPEAVFSGFAPITEELGNSMPVYYLACGQPPPTDDSPLLIAKDGQTGEFYVLYSPSARIETLSTRCRARALQLIAARPCPAVASLLEDAGGASLSQDASLAITRYDLEAGPFRPASRFEQFLGKIQFTKTTGRYGTEGHFRMTPRACSLLGGILDFADRHAESLGSLDATCETQAEYELALAGKTIEFRTSQIRASVWLPFRYMIYLLMEEVGDPEHQTDSD